MRKQKNKPTPTKAGRLPKPAEGEPLLAAPGKTGWLPAPKVRKLCGDVSAVTWWRWRNDPTLDFPVGKVIRGRWYFPVGPVLDWWANRPERRAAT